MQYQPDQFPVIIDEDVVWGEMDAFGYVNNTVYFDTLNRFVWPFFSRGDDELL